MNLLFFVSLILCLRNENICYNRGMETILLIILKFILYYFVALLIHEMGHLVAGIALGWQFYHISIGPIRISYDQNHKLHIHWIHSIGDWGGAVAIFPKSSDSCNIREVGIVVATGPIVTFFSALLMLKLVPILGWLLVCITILTALPYRKGNVYSDGGKLKRIYGNSDNAEIELAGFRIGSKVLQYGDFANVELRDIEILISSSDIRDQYRGIFYKWRYYVDVAEVTQAQIMKENLDEFGQSLPISLRKVLASKF